MIAANTAAIASNDTDIANLQSEQSTQNTNIATNTTNIATNTTNIAANTTNIAANTTNIATLVTRADETDTEQAAQDTTLADHETRLTTAEGNISTNATNIITNDAELADHETRITTLENATGVVRNQYGLWALTGLDTVLDNQPLRAPSIVAIAYAGNSNPINFSYSSVSGVFSVNEPGKSYKMMSKIAFVYPTDGGDYCELQTSLDGTTWESINSELWFIHTYNGAANPISHWVFTVPTTGAQTYYWRYVNLPGGNSSNV